MHIQLQAIDEATLYAIGREIGEVAQRRPDAVHRLLVGLRDGLECANLPTYGLGDILWSLWGQWHHTLRQNDVTPPIPFMPQNASSGQGKLKE